MLTRKGQATRARIVEGAARLMFEHGVAGTTMDHVREAAGVSFSQLYHYFTDKMALVRAVIAYRADAILANQPPALDSMEALHTWRDSLIEMQQRSQCKGGCPLGTLSNELSEISDDARSDVAAGFARWEESLRRGLTVMHERGELRAEVDPARLALATLAALQGGLLLTQVRRETAPLEASLDAILAHIASLRVAA